MPQSLFARPGLPGGSRWSPAEFLSGDRPAFERVVACREVVALAAAQERFLDVAMPRIEARAAGVEDAGRRRVDRRGNLPAENDAAAALGRRPGDGREKRCCVWVARVA